MAAALTGWLAACALVGALFLAREHTRARLRERALAVLYRYVSPRERKPSRISQRLSPIIMRVKRRLWQAGIEPAQWQLVVLVVLGFIALGAGFSALGLAGAVIALALILAFAYAGLMLQAERRRQRMVEQLPGFVDQLLRMVNVGSTLEEALVAATREAALPLRQVFEPVVRQTRLGGSVDEALEMASDRYNLQELRFLTTAVRISRRYGSSVKEMLNSIVTMIREQERARRELRGMTSETRASAWILGALPVLLVGYMLAVNPGFFLGLWNDETGRVLVFVAVAMQVSGVIVLWRLLKSV
ncbi:type II secretion system F family protein [uncultured Halovibrio sp.]|uniref:type II secretion system F family protein n=1 Tax=uncultured Halovibrio sp. TaxID=985049 RepID=UPI0025E8A00E|nr:type II secretion system F family protein [uncultured Halovibrio sp.]